MLNLKLRRLSHPKKQASPPNLLNQQRNQLKRRRVNQKLKLLYVSVISLSVISLLVISLLVISLSVISLSVISLSVISQSISD